ncbi:FxLYD domain-containing protein [Halorientalis halophila]|uniref:FxLYD domain-containing protein n=1 Tax=Halorientalis halophila TaxID=3108499 RepID=UPI0030092730
MKRRALLTAAGVVLTGGIAGCSEEREYEPGSGDGSNGGDGGNGSEPIPTPEATPEDRPPAESLTILEHSVVRTEEGTDWETLSVEGRVRNDSDRQFGYAEIRVRFYNADGDLLDSMIDNVNDLDPGQVWQFSVPFLGWGAEAQAVDDYDIAVGTTF